MSDVRDTLAAGSQPDSQSHSQSGQQQGWAPIDLLLGQGDETELARMRSDVAADPLLALELADTVELLEQLRQVRVEASPNFAGKLCDVTTRAERRLSARDRFGPATRHLPWVAALAAAATFAALWWLDPIGQWRQVDTTPTVSWTPANVPVEDEEAVPGAGQTWRDSSEVEWESAVDQMRRRLALEPSSHLRDAFEAGLLAARDPLLQWLDPSNAVVLLRLDHELRGSAEVRADALRQRGGLPAVDGRVQELAEIIADDLLQLVDGAGDLAGVVYGMRALIGAGSTAIRAAALQRSGDWLAQQLPDLTGEQLALGLSGLLELAAISGRHVDDVRQHGNRLLDEVLVPDDETWARRRPVLLSGRMVASTLGDAGRLLRRLPAFGLSAERCRLVRRLLLGQLREQRDLGQDRPELLAAMLYGCADLLEHDERDRVEFVLRRWRPVLLAPDFVTVQQWAWSIEPGRRGFARLQGELRQLAVLPVPDDLRQRAAFCLCLATNFASQVGSLVPDSVRARRS